METAGVNLCRRYGRQTDNLHLGLNYPIRLRPERLSAPDSSK